MKTQPVAADRFHSFDDAGRAVVLHRHDTPSPWINYLSNSRLHAFVSQAGGGMCWWRSPLINRLTRYRFFNQPIDSPGFYIYLREADGSVWSPTQRPCATKLDAWEARHLPGRTVFTARKGDLSAELELFVTPDHDVLVWDLALTNHGATARALDAFAYCEFSQLDWAPEANWGYYIRLMLKAWFDAESGSVMYLYHQSTKERCREQPLVFLSATEPVASFSTDRDAFIGNYRSEASPLGVERGRLGNESLGAGEACGALHCPVKLAPGERKRVSFLLGAMPGGLVDQAGTQARIRASLAALRLPGAIDAQRELSKRWWDRHLGAFDCTLPDKDSERQIRTWTPVQCVHTGRYSRSISSTAPGIRGIGFRDTCQDMMAIAYRDPAWAIDSFLLLLTQQYADGHAVHTSWPVEKQAPSTSVHSDDHLWLPLLAHAILAETGDHSLLDRRADFLADDSKGPGASATVWEHLLACCRFTESHLGTHGLPLTLRSDWNDIISKFAQAGRGESVFAAQQYVLALRQLIAIAGAGGRGADAAWLRGCLDRQLASLAACSWDGAWFRRAFDDDGAPVGSTSSPFGKLWLNSQSWAVLADAGTPAQQRQAMDEAAARLSTGLGWKKLDPGFATWGEVEDPFASYGPGCGENGAIFCHANAWAIIAEAVLGRGDRAWALFRELVPHLAMQKAGAQRYQAEPYAYVSNIIGPENPRFGWANVTQVTGTAAWMDIAGTQYLLGLRPVLDGLLIDPCLPPDWDGFTAERTFRGCRISVRVSDPLRHGHGVRSLRVDGRDIDLSRGPLLTAALCAGRTSLTVEVGL